MIKRAAPLTEGINISKEERKMGVLNELKPQKVFQFFEEICNIPHGSGHTKEISDYCVEFARKRGLRYRQDEKNNIVILKKGSVGYEKEEPVILQGHIDMVCEKEADCTLDLEKDGLQLAVEGDLVYAKGTTLGGDDGIAVAMALAILDDDTAKHPPLEVVFTVDEEIGMLGASAMDCSILKGRRMLNIDSEEEGHFLLGCAGGATVTCTIPVKRRRWRGQTAIVRISGVTGGHSGSEIQKEGANANVLLGRILYRLNQKTEIALIRVDGGSKDNAIPRSSEAVLMLVPGEEEVFLSVLEEMQEELAKEYHKTDPDLLIEGWTQIAETEAKNAGKWLPLAKESTNAVITALKCLPFGIQRMSPEIEDLVQTSLNPGILMTGEEETAISYSVRSSVDLEKKELIERLACLTESLGGSIRLEGGYPAWERKEDSTLQRLMEEVYREMYGQEPVLEILHVGVECGLFAGKMPGLDCIAYGPDVYDIHTTKERLSIASTKRVYEYTLEVLSRLKGL